MSYQKVVERYKVGTGHVERIWEKLEKGNGGKYYISLFTCMKFSTIKKNYNLKKLDAKTIAEHITYFGCMAYRNSTELGSFPLPMQADRKQSP